MKLAGMIWLALFGVTLTFIMGVIVWALAGPTEAVAIFAAAVLLFVALPAYLARHR